MNYSKIHSNFIAYFRNTTPVQRLAKRNASDLRLQSNNLYTELHHITPKSLGGLNVKTNLIEILPEEHIFIHQLRYKAFNSREDMLAVRFCLNGFKGKQYIPTTGRLTKSLRSGYAWMRQNSADFRKVHGWQTQSGREAISKARRNMMPAVDAVTRISVGSVPTDHINVVSGRWIHPTTGFITALDTTTNLKVRVTTAEFANNSDYIVVTRDMAGTANSNYSGISDDEILQHAVNFSGIIHHIPPYGSLVKYCKTINVNIPKHLSAMRFNGKGITGYLEQIKRLLPEVPYDLYYYRRNK